MYDCNVLYSILLTHSMSVLSTDVSTAQYLRSLLSTDVSTVQYLDNKYWVSFTMCKKENETFLFLSSVTAPRSSTHVGPYYHLLQILHTFFTFYSGIPYEINT